MFISWVIFTVVLGALYIRVPPSPDQSFHDYIGWVIAHEHGIPYVDAAGTDWPGAMLIHAVSTALFGNVLWSYRAFDFMMLLAGCAVLYAFSQRYQDRLTAALIVPLYQVMYVSAGMWMAGQRDIIAVPLLFSAGYCMLRRLDDGPRSWCALAGVLVAVAVLMKPTYLLYAPLLTLCDVISIRRFRRSWSTLVFDHAVLAGGLLGVLGAVAIMGAPSGALEGWYVAAVRFNLEVYGQRRYSDTNVLFRLLHNIVLSWHWYSLFAFAGLVLCWRRSGGTAPAITVVLMIAVTVIVSFYVQGKGWFYHAAGLLPVLAWFVAPLFAAAVSRLVRRDENPVITLLAIVVCCVITGGLAKKAWGALHLQVGWYAGTISTERMLEHYTAGSGINLKHAVAAATYVRRIVPPGK